MTLNVVARQTAKVNQALALLAAFGLTATATAAPSLTARLDREVVPVGETVTLTLAFEDVSPTGTPNLPALPNLQQIGVSSSRQFSFGTGQNVSRLNFEYTLQATAPGDVNIPSLQIQVGGQTLVSQPLRLKIVSAAGQTAQTNLAFLRLVVPKNEVYLGEPFAVEIHLYFQNADLSQAPQLKAEGFSIGQSAKPTQTATAVNGVNYNVVTFRMSATAAKTGTLTLGPAGMPVTLLVAAPNRRRDPFADFFGGGVQRRPINLASDPQTMRVLPLPPQNVPDNFNGAVGQFELAVTVGPTNLAVGDPITVKAQVRGRGALDSVTLPPQPQWRDFKTYPPNISVESSDPLGLSGAKTFEQVVIPENHEVKVLPSLRFSFFDPAARAYRTLSNGPVALAVRPSALAATPLPALTNAGAAPKEPPPVDDIERIRDRFEPVVAAAPLLLRQPWFVAAQGVPALLWLVLLGLRKRNEALANNPRLRRQREVAQRVREGLRDLRAQGAAQQAEEFFATLFRLLQEQLGERLDLPASAITGAVVEERLHGRAVPEQTLAELQALFHTCDQARYAPVASAHELAALVPRVESVLRELQNWKA